MLPPPSLQLHRCTGSGCRHTVGAAPFGIPLVAAKNQLGQNAATSHADRQPLSTSGPLNTTAHAPTLRVEAKTLENPSLPPIPPQLLQNIENGKYIYMGDLLLEVLSKVFDSSQRDTRIIQHHPSTNLQSLPLLIGLWPFPHTQQE